MRIFYRGVQKLLCLLLSLTWIHPAYSQEPVSLPQAMEVARNNSPDILRAKMSLEASEERLKAQNAALKSRFSLTLEPILYDRSDEFNAFFSTFNRTETVQSSGLFLVSQPIVPTDGTLSLRNQFSWRDVTSEFGSAQNRSFSNNLFLTYQQPIFTYNRTKLDLRDVELDLENTQINYSLQELLLEVQVAQAFYGAFRQKMSLQVSQEEYQNTQRSYQIIENKVSAGLAAREELYQAELNLTSSRSTVQNNQVAMENSLDDFKRLIGMPISEEISVVAEVTQEPVEVNLDKAIEFALKNRQELRQRKINIQSAKANLTRSSAVNEFRGDINLSYGIFGNDEEFSRLYDKPTENQRVSLSLEIPLYDWGERKSRIRAAEVSVESSNLSLEEEKTGIIIDIRKAYRNLENQVIQIEIAQQNVRTAQLTYDINLERYENGDLTSMDLNQFQTQLSAKKIGLVEALINYKLALLDLKVKSLWDFERNQPVLIGNQDEN
ncbi:MAG: TolC family protein [Calditrichaeota bacterium]|nr:TolC family protein [Calditrichota bacterium]